MENIVFEQAITSSLDWSVLFSKYRTEPNLLIPNTLGTEFFRNRSVHISQEPNFHRYWSTESIGSVFTECLGLGKGTRPAVMGFPPLGGKAWYQHVIWAGVRLRAWVNLSILPGRDERDVPGWFPYGRRNGRWRRRDVTRVMFVCTVIVWSSSGWCTSDGVYVLW
jgi:hypothetical protein